MIFTNARVVLRDEIIDATVVVEHGRIAAIDPGRSQVPEAIDLNGDWLMPGLIELHTDNLEKHMMPRPKVRWPMLPAILAHDAQIAAAGITTVLDAIAIGDIDHESMRTEALGESLEVLGHAIDERLLRAEHLLHLRCEIAVAEVVELFTPFVSDPRVRLVSVMDHTPGQRQWTDISHYRTYVTGKKGWSEDKVQAMLARLSSAQAQYADAHRMQILALCQSHGVPVATHDDTTLAHIHQARDEGVSISEFPTTLEAAQAARAHGMGIVMGGPNVVRGGSHSGNVAAIELARHDLLDALSSDYVPASLLHAAFVLADDAGWSLPRAIASVSTTPAAMIGLADRGEIALDKRADLIRVARAAPQVGGSPVVSQVWRAGERIV